MSLCSHPVTPVSELVDKRENLAVNKPGQISSGIAAYNNERKLLVVERLRWFKRRTASFHSFAVEIKQARKGTDRQNWAVRVAKTCYAPGSHQKPPLWHVHVFVQSGHSEAMPATNSVCLAALKRNNFHGAPGSVPAWSCRLWASRRLYK